MSDVVTSAPPRFCTQCGASLDGKDVCPNCGVAAGVKVSEVRAGVPQGRTLNVSPGDVERYKNAVIDVGLFRMVAGSVAALVAAFTPWWYIHGFVAAQSINIHLPGTVTTLLTIIAIAMAGVYWVPGWERYRTLVREISILLTGVVAGAAILAFGTVDSTVAAFASQFVSTGVGVYFIVLAVILWGVGLWLPRSVFGDQR